MSIAPRPSRRASATFVSGNILRHILVMTGTSAAGLMAIFLGDLANILFLSMLGDVEIVAAVGYASSLLFLTTAVGIGLAIGATSVVAPRIGAGQRVLARRIAASAHVCTLLVATAIVIVVWLFIPEALGLLGATGRTQALASDYLRTLVPFMVPLSLGMTSSAVLRSVGDARRSMHVTLSTAAVNIALDPIFIFGLGLGIQGAAWASAIARVVAACVGLVAVVRVHDMLGRVKPRAFIGDTGLIAAVALPAVLTNIANPAANAYITAAIATFGDDAVAGWAIIGRVMPVAFGAIYALSTAVGPIIGQNFGAGARHRVRATLTESLLVNGVFTIVAWLVLLLASQPLITLFRAEGATAELVLLFCQWLAPLFVFLGALFVANAVFNTLGRPHVATAFNWARATVGTVPFVLIGGHYGGAPGVLIGNMAGGILFGVAAVWGSYELVNRVMPSPPASDKAVKKP